MSKPNLAIPAGIAREQGLQLHRCMVLGRVFLHMSLKGFECLQEGGDEACIVPLSHPAISCPPSAWQSKTLQVGASAPPLQAGLIGLRLSWKMYEQK